MKRELRAPFSRNEVKVRSLSWDVLIALLPVVLFALISFGNRVLLILGVSILTAILCEIFACLLGKKPLMLSDGSAAVTGTLIALLMSPAVPLWLPMVAAAFAILIVKMPFGGAGHNLFNPAAAGIAFVTQCFSETFFAYPANNVTLPFAWDVGDITYAASPATLLYTGGNSPYAWYELILGQAVGPMGTVAILVLCSSAVYLFTRRAGAPVLTVSFLLTCAVIAALFPRTMVSWYQSILLELCSGYLVFGSIFLLNDPVTSPRNTLSHLLYGVLAGCLVMLLRHVGRFEEGLCFAILLCNTVAGAIDRTAWRISHAIRARRKERSV